MPMLNLKQAALKVGLKPRTLRRYVAEGGVVAYREGRELRFREEDLNAFIASRRVRVTPRLAEAA